MARKQILKYAKNVTDAKEDRDYHSGLNVVSGKTKRGEIVQQYRLDQGDEMPDYSKSVRSALLRKRKRKQN